jgi:hypothetical protein
MDAVPAMQARFVQCMNLGSMPPNAAAKMKTMVRPIAASIPAIAGLVRKTTMYQKAS